MSPWLSAFGIFPRAERERALVSLDRVQLLHKAGDRADRLSGGEKQRVSIARALAQEPWVILADEPVASLDPTLAHEVMGFLRRAATEERIPVLVNIHDVSLAQEYADQGATIIYVLAAIGPMARTPDAISLTLSGPGIETERYLTLSGLDTSEFGHLSAANRDYPMGVDAIVLDPGGRVACLPRSCNIVARASGAEGT